MPWDEISKMDRKIEFALIARRPSLKKRYPNCWEFGCAQLQLGERFAECMTRRYKEDFSADLRFSHPIVPVSTFELEDPSENRTIPGLIFPAICENPEVVMKEFRKDKHSELKWISEKEWEDIPESEAVPGFHNSISLALRALDAEFCS